MAANHSIVSLKHLNFAENKHRAMALHITNNMTTTYDVTTTIAPKLSNNFSRIATIIYISLYVLILFIIGIIIKMKSGITICSKKYFKALWIQKGIYLAILIHIYDTATDVGVLIDWYFLMENERKGFNYENIDMRVFFWCGIASLSVYKIWSAYMSWYHGKVYHYWYSLTMCTLSLFELSIFVYVYNSFTRAEPKLNRYYEMEKNRKQLKSDMKDKMKNEIELQTETIDKNNDAIKALDDQMSAIIEHVKPQLLQRVFQLYEAMFESMPQIILQSIFLLRSYNTPLSQDSNSFLVVTSLIASALCISTKIVTWDINRLSSQSKSIASSHGCKVKLICWNNKCSFDGCNNWYFIRVFWRLSNIFNRFIILSLIWTVLGGIIFAIYIGISILYNIIIMWCSEDIGKLNGVGIIFRGAANVLVLVKLTTKNILRIVIKFLDHLTMLILITLFATINIECDLCTNICTRTLNNINNNCGINWERNDLLLIFIISSWIVYIFDIFFSIIIFKFKPKLFV